MKVLDLFSGAGGAALGYYRAGFSVTGIDLAPQPSFPFDFIQADCLELEPAYLQQFDLIHASPPCQAHTMLKHAPNGKAHADLIPATRFLLQTAGVPYVIENVVGAPLQNAVTLCGTMFRLGAWDRGQWYKLQRHRLFEAYRNPHLREWSRRSHRKPLCLGSRRMTAILGIDPGLSGALALYQPSQLIVWDIPVLTIERNGKARRDTDLHQLLALFRIAKREGATAVLEQINAQPGNGATQAFSYGKGYGAILMGLAACELPLEYAPPQTWKKALSVPKEKDGARARASELLPMHSSLWPLKKHDGRAEAALIAEFGRRKLQAF